MTDADAVRDALERKLASFIAQVLKLGDDVKIDPEKNLIAQIGLDSIEALDALATLHELMGVSIPDQFNLKTLESLRSLAVYIQRQFGPEAAQRFLEMDLSGMDFSRSEEM